MRKFVPLFLLLLLCFPAVSAAHPGRTDADGGHYDRSTGEYHYHHGYPAHQHTDGICPYDYDDQTGSNSGSSSGGYIRDISPLLLSILHTVMVMMMVIFTAIMMVMITVLTMAMSKLLCKRMKNISLF